MELTSHILNDIKPFKNTDTIKDLKLLCNQLTYSHIPIENKEGVFLGSYSETDIHCFDSNKTLNDYTYAIEGFFVRENTAWLEVLEAFASNNTNVMPILDKDNNYLGYYELKDIISLFNETPFFNEKINGVAMKFKKAHLRIGDQSFSVDVNNSDQAAVFEIVVEEGRTDLLAYFDLVDGVQSNAFYVYAERL